MNRGETIGRLLPCGSAVAIFARSKQNPAGGSDREIHVGVTGLKEHNGSLMPMVRRGVLLEIERSYDRRDTLVTASESVEKERRRRREVKEEREMIKVYVNTLKAMVEGGELGEEEVVKKVEEVYERWRKISGYVG